MQLGKELTLEEKIILIEKHGFTKHGFRIAELTLDEKIILIEKHGFTAAEVHQDPNPGLAFSLFGPDPGTASEDDDYIPRKTKRKLEPEPETSPKSAKQAKPTIKFKTWQEDEVMFVLERFAENPQTKNKELTLLVNEKFKDEPLPGGDGTETRGERSRQSLWQRFSSRKTVDTLIERLDEQTDRDAPSFGWKNKGIKEEQAGESEEN